MSREVCCYLGVILSSVSFYSLAEQQHNGENEIRNSIFQQLTVEGLPLINNALFGQQTQPTS